MEILAVSVEEDDLQKKMIDRVKETYDVDIEFTLLTDTDHRVIDRYGVFNPENQMAVIPHPTTMVIDEEGVIRWMVVELDYRMRPETEDILEALELIR